MEKNFDRVYRMLFHDGEVCELVADGLVGASDAWDGEAEGVVSGRFDNAEAFADAEEALIDAGAASVRVTLNPIDARFAGERNRLRVGYGTTHYDIEVIRWLPVVVDSERRAAVIRAALATEFKAAVGPSGRMDGGAFVLVRLPDLDVFDHLSPALEALGGRFDTEAAKVDRGFYRPESGIPVAALAAADGPAALDEIPVNPRGLLDRLKAVFPVARGGKSVSVGDSDTGAFLAVEDGGRARFNDVEAARWFGEKFGPIRYDGASFWTWDRRGGVWKILPRPMLQSLFLHAVRDGWKPALGKRIVDALAAMYYRDPDEAEPSPYLINCRNGVVDLHSGELLEHSPERCGAVQIAARFDPTATCPRWMRFLDEIMPGDADKITVLRQFAGYTLFRQILAPAVLFTVGSGRNGKSVFIDTLSAMLGEGAVCHVDLKSMAGKYGPAYLHGMLLNTAAEAGSVKHIEADTFKAVSAGDRIQAERKNMPDLTFRPYAKHCFAMNEVPRLTGAADALIQRVRLIEFTQRFTDAADDVFLRETLRGELDGIFMWALGGLREVLDNGGKVARPASMAPAMTRLLEKLSPVAPFVHEACILQAGAEVVPAELFRAYTTWRTARGFAPGAGTNSMTTWSERTQEYGGARLAGAARGTPSRESP